MLRALSAFRSIRSLLLRPRNLKNAVIQVAAYETEPDVEEQHPDKVVLNDDIFGIENDEGVIIFDNVEVRLDKFKKLTNKDRNSEVLIKTSFGSVRRDRDNVEWDLSRFPKSKTFSKRNEKDSMKKNIQHQEQAETFKDLSDHRAPITNLESRPGKLFLSNKFLEERDTLGQDEVNNIEEFYLNKKNKKHKVKSQHSNNMNSRSTKSSNEEHLKSTVEDTEASSRQNELGYIDSLYFDGDINSTATKLSNEKHLDSAVADTKVSSLQNASNELDYIDTLYFDGDINSTATKLSNEKHLDSAVADTKVSSLQNASKELHYIDTLYFDELSASSLSSKASEPVSQSVLEQRKMETHSETMPHQKNLTSDDRNSPSQSEMDFSEIEEQYFGSNADFDSMLDMPPHLESDSSITFAKRLVMPQPKDLELPFDLNKKLSDENLLNRKLSKSVASSEQIVKSADRNNIWKEIQSKKEPDESLSGQKLATEDKTYKESSPTETAFDFVKKLRETKGTKTLPDGSLTTTTGLKLDSKGFRVLSNQVQDLSNLTKDELLNELKSRVLYSDDDIVVLDKPYNMVMHVAQSTKQLTLEPFLSGLSSMIEGGSADSQLITVHRLDKTTTGCLLLARNEAAALHLKSLFAQRKVKKTYWIVTIHTPEHRVGVIDMPISEGTIDTRARMVLRPDLPKDIPFKSHCRTGKRAITKYSVIATSGNAALIEAEATTGVKHQIRVHFGFGLNCPILGDHKYSHLDKMAPQKLPSDMLQRLHVRQSKVRYIPMHIHARSIVIPRYFGDRDFFAYAPLPEHMRRNLQTLKFRKK